MLTREDIGREGTKVLKWIEHYFAILKDLPVKSQVRPKEIYSAIPAGIPYEGESFDQILKDTTDIILPGITHWQHPNFHAYFPANSSVESLFAEMITSAIAAQCMIWNTSPAAAELEERMMEWMRDAMGIPSSWEGVIQDTASTATLVAIICARERTTNFKANEEGIPPGLRIYCSSQTHSSIEKAAIVAGFGRKNVVKISVDADQRLNHTILEKQILEDLQKGHIPCCVVAAVGTTGTVAVDEIEQLGEICNAHDIWLHIDAAYAGSALFLPEYQWMIEGIDMADSFVFNPHKWLFTNFDCTAYYVKDAEHLIRTFEILPEYLKTETRGRVNDYRDWGIPLGRRFRALKLWYVLRSYGLSGIQQRLRKHIHLTETFVNSLSANDNFEIIIPPFLNTCGIRFNPSGHYKGEVALNQLNKSLLEQINNSGRAYLSHTMIDGKYVIRVVIGQTYVDQKDVDRLSGVLVDFAKVS